MRPILTAALATSLVAAFPLALHADSPSQAPADERVLDSAVVHGVVPGPGLWKVRHGENTLYILGLQGPLPAKMEWNAAKVKSVIAKADEVIWSPGISVNADVGMFGRLALLPSLLKVRANPDGKLLKDVVPAPSYERWLALKAKYVGRDASIEKYRPMFAASELYERAMDRSGLTSTQQVTREVQAAMKKRGLKATSTTATVQLADPKAALRGFKGSQIADLECFGKTLQRIETDLGHMRQRANAWATGDIAALRALQRPDQLEACKNAIMRSAVASRLGLEGAEAESRRKWTAAAGSALERNRVTFAVLSMRDLLNPSGPLATLAAKGYVVEEPARPAVAASH